MLIEINVRGHDKEIKRAFIRPDSVDEIVFHADFARIWVRSQGYRVEFHEAERVIAVINGTAATPPAAGVPSFADRLFPPGKWRHITSVEKFISKSGNESWKAESDDVVVYFRQVQKEMLKEAGLWDELNEMRVGEILDCSIVVYTVPDGDLHKIISIDPGGFVQAPEPADETHVEERDDDWQGSDEDERVDYSDVGPIFAEDDPDWEDDDDDS